MCVSIAVVMIGWLSPVSSLCGVELVHQALAQRDVHRRFTRSLSPSDEVVSSADVGVDAASGAGCFFTRRLLFVDGEAGASDFGEGSTIDTGFSGCLFRDRVGNCFRCELGDRLEKTGERGCLRLRLAGLTEIRHHATSPPVSSRARECLQDLSRELTWSGKRTCAVADPLAGSLLDGLPAFRALRAFAQANGPAPQRREPTDRELAAIATVDAGGLGEPDRRGEDGARSPMISDLLVLPGLRSAWRGCRWETPHPGA
jgi:hypothetical protein